MINAKIVTVTLLALGPRLLLARPRPKIVTIGYSIRKQYTKIVTVKRLAFGPRLLLIVPIARPRPKIVTV